MIVGVSLVWHHDVINDHAVGCKQALSPMPFLGAKMEDNTSVFNSRRLRREGEMMSSDSSEGVMGRTALTAPWTSDSWLMNGRSHNIQGNWCKGH